MSNELLEGFLYYYIISKATFKQLKESHFSWLIKEKLFLQEQDIQKIKCIDDSFKEGEA